MTSLWTSCGFDQTNTGLPAQVNGEIIFPPQAGQALFYTDSGSGATQALVSFAVGQSGQYAITLPPPSQLSAAGNTALLATLPDVWLMGFSRISCPALSTPGTLNSSDQAARMAVISSGKFMLDGVTVAQLLPSTQAVGGLGLSAQELATSKKMYAYTDRAVQISGQVACTLTRSDSTTLGATLHLNYQLSSGWNVLSLQTNQSTRTSPLEITASAETPSTPVQWRYYPTQ